MRRAEEEARRKAEEEEARRRAEEEEARRRAEEEEARRREEEEARIAEEMRRAEEEEAKRKAEEEARRAEEAKRKAEEEARKRAEEEARRKAEEEERKAEEERRRMEEEERKAEEERLKAEKEEKSKKEREELERKSAIERKKAEIAEKRRKEQEAKLAADKAAADKAAADSASSDNAAAEKAAAEKAAAEKAAAEKAAAEKAAAEKAAADKAAKAAADKAAAEKAAAQRAQKAVEKPQSEPKKTVSASSSRPDYAGHILALNFVLRAMNKRGEPKTVGGDVDQISITANGQKISRIEDNGDGNYSFDYETTPGDNSVQVSFKGKEVKGFPLSFQRKTMEEIEMEVALKEEEERAMREAAEAEEERARMEAAMEEEIRRQEEERAMEEEMRKQLEAQQQENEREAAEDKELEKAMQYELQQQEIQEKTRDNSKASGEAVSESETKLQEIEDRKRKIAEKRAEIARKREQNEALATAADISTTKNIENVRAKVWESRLQQGEQTSASKSKPVDLPTSEKSASKLSSLWEQRLQGSTEEEKKPAPKPATTPVSKGNAAARWLQSAQEEDKKDDKKTKVDLPLGSGASKVASLWQTRLAGGIEEKKVEKTSVDLGGQGASKVANLWQSREQGKEAEPQEIKKTTVDIPAGGGASKVASLWQSKVEEKPAEPKLEKGQTPRRTGPSTLAAKWEQNANSTPSATTPNSKKDIDELKQLMAKEREVLSSRPSDSSQFTNDPDEAEILLHFLSTGLKGEKIPQSLPLKSDNPNVWSDLSDGIALCRFFNKMVPDIMDVRVINARVNDKRDKTENWNLCVQSARSAGCRLHDVKIEALVEGDPVSIQNVIFQIAKVGLETDIKMYEEYLADWISEMDADALAVANIDDVLIKWVNAVVAKAGHSRVAKNLTKDFQDSFLLVVLFNEILGVGIDLEDATDLERAEMILMSSSDLNRGPLITLPGIVDGVYWQLYFLLSSLLLTAAELGK
uniref:Calponin-homology (CH) domain-containing protein n=1 Tax=Arcella intermedia TaxID=1963864 RepID=A0A6B2KXF8_9EUKA